MPFDLALPESTGLLEQFLYAESLGDLRFDAFLIKKLRTDKL